MVSMYVWKLNLNQSEEKAEKMRIFFLEVYLIELVK